MTTYLEMFGKLATAMVQGLLVVLTVSVCQAGSTTATKEVKINGGLSFSADNTKLLLERCVQKQYCAISVYELSTGQWSEYRSPQDEWWMDARYSDDGQKIVFVKIPRKVGQAPIAYEQMQIATMNPDGSEVRTITNHASPK
jgi:Tol biopolymer transport system component